MAIIKHGSKKLNGSKKLAGFTLIEVTVSVALFAIIMVSAAQIFKMVIDSQRSAQATQNVQESLRYFLEVIGKEIRMAQADTKNICGRGVTGQVFFVGGTAGNNTLSFKNYYDECVTYSLAPDPTTATIERFQIARTPLGTDFISPAQITIDSLNFVVSTAIQPKAQPMVTINLKAHAVNERQFQSSMTIQTSLTSRYYK